MLQTVHIAIIAVVIIVIVCVLLCRKSGFFKKRGGKSSDKGRKRVVTRKVVKSGFDVADTNAQLNAQLEMAKQLQGYDDYSQVTQLVGLEPEVFQSHAEYTADLNRSTSGASSMSIRSDDGYFIPFVGLRRPDLQSITPSSDARVTSSQDPAQMPTETPYCIY